MSKFSEEQKRKMRAMYVVNKAMERIQEREKSSLTIDTAKPRKQRSMKKEILIGVAAIVMVCILWIWRAPGPYQLVEIDERVAVCDTRTGETWEHYSNGVMYINPKTGIKDFIKYSWLEDGK